MSIQKAIVICIWFLPANANFNLYLDRFDNIEQFDAQLCATASIVFKGFNKRIFDCAMQCSAENTCSGFSYNERIGECIGCREMNGPTNIVAEEGTKYFKGQWLPFEGKAYKVSDRVMSFYEGEEYCKSVGGHFAKVDSEEKGAFLRNQTWDHRHVWIGLTDEGHEGLWTWVVGDKVTNYTDWFPGPNTTQPEGGVFKNCAIIHGGYNFRWADRKCVQEYNVLCEK